MELRTGVWSYQVGLVAAKRLGLSEPIVELQINGVKFGEISVEFADFSTHTFVDMGDLPELVLFEEAPIESFWRVWAFDLINRPIPAPDMVQDTVKLDRFKVSLERFIGRNNTHAASVMVDGVCLAYVICDEACVILEANALQVSWMPGNRPYLTAVSK